MTGMRGFHAYVRKAAVAGRLVVQPRMGLGRVDAMWHGLCAVKTALDASPRIGTVTIDAYTRRGELDAAAAALREGRDLNGFPIITHGADVTRRMLEELRGPDFPVQVRHGTAFPGRIFEVAASAGFDAIEGGPISYTLPYAREPLSQTVDAWAAASRFWADYGDRKDVEAHLESFAGCMLGQLCPHGLPVALGILEGLFFAQNGIGHLSLSLAQGTNDSQDVGALVALRRLAGHYLTGVSWHIVYYTFMGFFPRTPEGAEAIIRASARIAVAGGAHRLIVKTAAEAHGIPTIEQNVEALRWARGEADSAPCNVVDTEAAAWADVICDEADALIAATRAAGPDIARGLLAAFGDGLLDVPYCPHPSNRNRTRTILHPETGAMLWGETGSMPLPATPSALASGPRSSAENADQFHKSIEFNMRRYDGLTDPVVPGNAVHG